MTREEFLHCLNRENGRFGVAEITDEILGDWLEAKIIDAPEQHGRIRIWTEIELNRAVKILRLKSSGVNILGEIRFHLWLDQPDIPLLDPKFDAPGILSREFLLQKKNLFGQIRSAYPNNRNPDPSGHSARSVLRKMGELDPCFEQWVEYAPEELLDAYTTLRFGNSSGHLGRVVSRLRPLILTQVVDDVLKRFPEIPRPLITAAIEVMPDEALSQVIGFFNWDEMEKTIFDASKSEYLLARRALNSAVILFRCLGLQKVSDSLRHPTWQTLMFVLLLRIIRR